MSAMQLAAMPQEGLQRMWALKGDLTEPGTGFTIYLSTVYGYILFGILLKLYTFWGILVCAFLSTQVGHLFP